jgi:hypothetical protein
MESWIAPKPVFFLLGEISPNLDLKIVISTYTKEFWPQKRSKFTGFQRKIKYKSPNWHIEFHVHCKHKPVAFKSNWTMLCLACVFQFFQNQGVVEVWWVQFKFGSDSCIHRSIVIIACLVPLLWPKNEDIFRRPFYINGFNTYVKF